MNELENYKNNKAKNYDRAAHCGHFSGEDPSYHYNNGFNAAIALELPIKFLNWKLLTPVSAISSIPEITWTTDLLSDNPKVYTTQELYDYWINNVYKSK